MQEHLHVGRVTWKRKLRGNLLLASIPVYFLLFGFPYIRGNFTNVNGRQVITYLSFAGEKNYLPDSKYTPPMFILVPLWLSHHNAAGMQWFSDGVIPINP